MGFEIASQGAASILNVWISYVPSRRNGFVGRIGAFLSARFASWCVEGQLSLGAGPVESMGRIAPGLQFQMIH